MEMISKVLGDLASEWSTGVQKGLREITRGKRVCYSSIRKG